MSEIPQKPFINRLFRLFPGQWVLLLFWGLGNTLSELLFLGVLKDLLSFSQSQDSYIPWAMDLFSSEFSLYWAAPLILILLLIFRSVFQAWGIRSYGSLVHLFRQSKIYQLSHMSNMTSLTSWSERREQQHQLESALFATKASLLAALHFLVFLPVILWNSSVLFGVFTLGFLPVVILGSFLRRKLKSSAQDLRNSRAWIFRQLEACAAFQQQWVHPLLLKRNQEVSLQLTREWSEHDLEYYHHSEMVKSQVDFVNSMSVVVVLCVSVLGVHLDWYSLEQVVFFVSALLVSYQPMKSLQLFKNSQVQSEELLQAQDSIHDQLVLPMQDAIEVHPHNIILKDLKLQAGSQVLIDSLSWDIPAGVHVIQGDNGVGKSTLLRSILCFPGESSLVYLDQFPQVPSFATIASSLDQIPGELQQLLGWGQLEINEDNWFELSGGEIQRVLIGLTLSQEADWYILDEPIANVSYAQRSKILQGLQDYCVQQGLNVLMVHHDYPQAHPQVKHWIFNHQGIQGHEI